MSHRAGETLAGPRSLGLQILCTEALPLLLLCPWAVPAPYHTLHTHNQPVRFPKSWFRQRRIFSFRECFELVGTAVRDGNCTYTEEHQEEVGKALPLRRSRTC